ncbi:MAG TPA: Asp-tRNA(Asn)/Glu-tRNA(Gln) amidotransferase subunit GatB [Clostridiales bacterium]|nr:Asp-tRNA(Asn)/Glu-tRNA(Gln) amidotransferase subunit GatB [Clostridiales bacterium]
MAITRENVEYIANLARLDPKGEGFDQIAEDMQNIVAMVDQLQELELGDITDIIDTDRKNAMREDVPVESFDKETILANAPCVECGGVSVPRVVE